MTPKFDKLVEENWKALPMAALMALQGDASPNVSKTTKTVDPNKPNCKRISF